MWVEKWNEEIAMQNWMKDYGVLFSGSFFVAVVVAGFLMIATPLVAQEESQEPPQSTTAMTQNQASLSEGYTIQEGDELEIKSFYNPELNERVVVRPDGRISVQLANEVAAAGRTPAELASALTQTYSQYFKQPEVTIILRTFAGQRVFVAGEVGRPGMVPLIGRMTVLQSVAAVEGFADTARLDEVILIRRAPDRTPTVRTIDLKLAMNGSDMTQDMVLQPYDIVFVPRSRIANVNRFVDQFIRRNIPVPFSLSYRINDPRND